MPAFVVDLNFKPPSWLGWVKLLHATINWSLSATTFSMSLPRVLSRTMGWKAFGWSYEVLLGLGMMIVDKILKCLGQYPRLIHESAILIMLVRQRSCLTMNFRWRQVSLSGSGADASLHLLITDLNSSLENKLHLWEGLCSTLLRILRSTWWFKALLKVLWSAFHRLSGVRYGWPL